MTSRTSGDAKWYFNEVPVSAGQTYQFSDYYMANVPTYVTAQFHMQDGTFQYKDIAILPAASTWSNAQGSFTAPANIAAVTIFHLINQVGVLTTDNYSMAQAAAPLPGGMLSITFDDGVLTTYQNAIPILDQAGLKSTNYIITGRMFDGFPEYIKAADVLSLQARGHEIGAHTVTHPDLALIPFAQAQYEINQSKQDLLNIGVNSVNTFAYPFGSYNAQAVQIVQNAGYMGARSTDGGYDDPTSNKFILSRQGIDITTTVAQVQGWVDYAAQNNLWLILVFHHVDDSATTYSTTPAMFQQMINYIVQKQIPVVTMTQGLQKLFP
jgi:peptidoglycan/xylan/chitin deacetylase (PgdA/CDA1 family)